MIVARIVLRLFVASALGLGAFGPAHAQTYPDRPIKLIVPFPPGGPTDVMARLVAQHLSTGLGQNVIIDNRPGAGGTVGSKAAASADPDGYTLLLGSTSTLAIAPALYGNLGYDPKGFAPVAMLASIPYVLVVAPNVPAKSVGELVAYAKANPGKLNYSSAGNGTPPHLIAELFKVATGTDIVHVPYRGGAPALADVLGGQVQMMFEGSSVVIPYAREGQLRALAIATATRSAEIPDVPTMIESGVAGFTPYSWSGIVAPAGTPAGVVALLNGAVNKALASPAMQASLGRLGAEARIGSPADFSAFIADELRKWGELVRISGARID